MALTARVQPSSNWALPPTGPQRRDIARLCTQLGIRELLEERPSNRWEARGLQYRLMQARKYRRATHSRKEVTDG